MTERAIEERWAAGRRLQEQMADKHRYIEPTNQ
jgi:hypothetical protein